MPVGALRGGREGCRLLTLDAFDVLDEDGEGGTLEVVEVVDHLSAHVGRDGPARRLHLREDLRSGPPVFQFLYVTPKPCLKPRVAPPNQQDEDEKRRTRKKQTHRNDVLDDDHLMAFERPGNARRFAQSEQSKDIAAVHAESIRKRLDLRHSPERQGYEGSGEQPDGK